MLKICYRNPSGKLSALQVVAALFFTIAAVDNVPAKACDIHSYERYRARDADRPIYNLLPACKLPRKKG